MEGEGLPFLTLNPWLLDARLRGVVEDYIVPVRRCRVLRNLLSQVCRELRKRLRDERYLLVAPVVSGYQKLPDCPTLQKECICVILGDSKTYSHYPHLQVFWVNYGESRRYDEGGIIVVRRHNMIHLRCAQEDTGNTRENIVKQDRMLSRRHICQCNQVCDKRLTNFSESWISDYVNPGFGITLELQTERKIKISFD